MDSINQNPNNSLRHNPNRNYPVFAEIGYQIQQELGHNKTGGRVTYRAINIETQQPVVIKQFLVC